MLQGFCKILYTMYPGEICINYWQAREEDLSCSETIKMPKNSYLTMAWQQDSNFIGFTLWLLSDLYQTWPVANSQPGNAESVWCECVCSVPCVVCVHGWWRKVKIGRHYKAIACGVQCNWGWSILTVTNLRKIFCRFVTVIRLWIPSLVCISTSYWS